MGDSDPYLPPSAELQTPVELDAGGQPLASRAARLGARLLDGLIAGAVIGPMQWFAGVYTEPQAALASSTLLWSAVGLIVTLTIQGYPLATRAQSLGKIALGIKIVTLDGRNADFMRIVLRRILPVSVVAAIPVGGVFLGLLDALLIFREDQRCLHDHLAETRVVRA